MDSMTQRKLRIAACVAAAVTLLTLPLAAQTARVPAPNRITQKVDNNQLTTLRGNVVPFATARYDHGPVSTSLPMPDLTLVLSRSPEQQAAFDQYVEGEYDPGSPNYHQWLTPSQIGSEFGPTEADIATITNWLTSQGFRILRVTPDRMAIRFAGTAGLAESAFHTQIDNLVVRGVPHIANMTNPSIPTALTPVVVGVKALHNFLPHPMHTAVNRVEYNSKLGGWQRVSSPLTSSSAPVSPFALASPTTASGTTARPRPLFTVNGSSGLEEDVSPYDFASIYNVAPLWNDSINGSGETIAIAGTSDIVLSDVSTFRSAFGLPAGLTPNEIDTNGLATECLSTSSSAVCGLGDLEENTLDVEWSGAVAPGAQIDLVVTGQNSAGTVDTVYDSAQYVVSHLTASILNVSYGLCELFSGTAENVAYYDLWQSAAAEGISVFAATGDSGSPSCDEGGDGIGNPYSAQYGLSVSSIASTPFDVAVGGTDFNWCKPVVNSSGEVTGCSTSNAATYWNSGNSSTTGESAIGYVPEIPWNDTCDNPTIAGYLESVASFIGVSGVTDAESACNFVQNDWYSIYQTYGTLLAPFVDTVGGSGGASNCVVNNADSVASNVLPTCTASATTTGVANGSIALTNDGWQKPSWQSQVTGIPADGVRDLPDVSFFAGNGALDSAYLVCISAAGSCTYTSQSNDDAEEAGGTSFASPAMAGVMALINQKAGSPQGLPNAQLYKLASQQDYADCSAEASSSSTSGCYFHSIDEGTNAMPCDLGASVGGAYYDGGWVIDPNDESPGIDSPNCTAIDSGDTVGTLTSTSVAGTGNTHGIAYNATAGFNMATGLGSLNVANVVNAWTSDTGAAKATIGVQLSATTITTTDPLTVTVTMTGSGATPTGSVTVAGGGYSAAQNLSSGAATIDVPAGSLSVGADTLTISYSGDATYAAGSTTKNVTVTTAAPTVSVALPATDDINNPVTVTVTVSVPSGAVTPTGTVTLTGGGYSSPAKTLASGAYTFTIPAATLTLGNDTLTATYSGNSLYTTATGTGTIDITGTVLLTPTVTVTPTPTNPGTAESVSVPVTVTGSGATPTGTVTLTGGGYTSAAETLTGGLYTFTIPANSLAVGTDTLTVTYSGDAAYNTKTGTATVTVTQSSYALAATTPTAISAGGTTTSTITGQTSSTGYAGTVTLNSCTLASSTVTNPNDPPSCSVSGTITYTGGAASGSGTATITTTANGTAMLHPAPGLKGWPGVAGGGAVFAALIFLGLPKRRRNWLAMLGLMVVFAGLVSLSGCGSGGGTSPILSGTSAGSYTFTVSATGSDANATPGTATFTVTVN